MFAQYTRWLCKLGIMYLFFRTQGIANNTSGQLNQTHSHINMSVSRHFFHLHQVHVKSPSAKITIIINWVCHLIRRAFRYVWLEDWNQSHCVEFSLFSWDWLQESSVTLRVQTLSHGHFMTLTWQSGSGISDFVMKTKVKYHTKHWEHTHTNVLIFSDSNEFN